MAVDWTTIVQLRDRQLGERELPLGAAVDTAATFDPSRLGIAEIWLSEPLDVGHGPECVFFADRIAQLIKLRCSDPGAPAQTRQASAGTG